MLLVGAHLGENICFSLVCLQAPMQDHVTWGSWAYVRPPDRGIGGCFHRLCTHNTSLMQFRAKASKLSLWRQESKQPTNFLTCARNVIHCAIGFKTFSGLKWQEATTIMLANKDNPCSSISSRLCFEYVPLASFVLFCHVWKYIFRVNFPWPDYPVISLVLSFWYLLFSAINNTEYMTTTCSYSAKSIVTWTLSLNEAFNDNSHAPVDSPDSLSPLFIPKSKTQSHDKSQNVPADLPIGDLYSVRVYIATIVSKTDRSEA